VILGVAVVVVAIVIGLAIGGGGGDATTRAFDAATTVLAGDASLTDEQIEASAGAAVASAEGRCNSGEGAPETGDATFDAAVVAAMEILCP